MYTGGEDCTAKMPATRSHLVFNIFFIIWLVNYERTRHEIPSSRQSIIIKNRHQSRNGLF